MTLFITKSAMSRQEDKGYEYHQYLLHEDEPLDSHRKYKDSSYTPKKGSNNPRNLFDDSDIKDNYWFNIARKFLSHY